MKVGKAIAILLFGPLTGILIAFVLSALALPPDANFVGHASPGDGFLTIGFVVASLLISVPFQSLGRPSSSSANPKVKLLTEPSSS